MGSFKCKRGGKCRALAVPVSEQDLVRWAIEYRNDILGKVLPHERLIRGNGTRCPFLIQLTPGVYGCRIYRTRPIARAQFPLSAQQAERIGCPGWRSKSALAQ